MRRTVLSTTATIAIAILLSTGSSAWGAVDGPPETTSPPRLGPELADAGTPEAADVARAEVTPLLDGGGSTTFRTLVRLTGDDVRIPDPAVAGDRFADADPAVRPALVRLAAGVDAARADVDRALAWLSDADLAGIVERTDPAWDAVQSKALGRAGPAEEAEIAAYRDRLQRIDQASLARAQMHLLVAAEDARRRLGDVQAAGTEGTCADGGVVFEDPTCSVILGGSGPNTYENESAIVVDLGGADTYLNDAGGGDLDAAVQIDLGTADDLYRTPARGGDAFQGAGFFGAGLLVDEGGDDTYDVETTSTSAGARISAQGTGLGGTGVLWDLGGNDSYHARNIAQGGGLTGYGLLLDDGGSDNYTIPWTFDSEGGQGTGCWGGSAALVDRGTAPDGYNASIDDMQGFACLPGSVGILLDEGGGDGYLLRSGEGSLSGNNVVQSGWGQAYGELGGVGILMDVAGDDVYNTTSPEDRRYEAMHTHGAGLAGGGGILVDDGGSDRYIALHRAQGYASLGAFGILADAAGADAYRAADRCQGYALAASSLLLDGGGSDSYDCGEPTIVGTRGDGQSWSAGIGGAGVDV